MKKLSLALRRLHLVGTRASPFKFDALVVAALAYEQTMRDPGMSLPDLAGWSRSHVDEEIAMVGQALRPRA